MSTGKTLIQYTLEFGIFPLNEQKDIINAFADIRCFGVGAQLFPTRSLWHPENIFFRVIIPNFQSFFYFCLRVGKKAVFILFIFKTRLKPLAVSLKGIRNIF